MEPTRSPYAVPLEELEAARVRPEQLVCLVPDSHLRFAGGGLVAGPFDGAGLHVDDGCDG